ITYTCGLRITLNSCRLNCHSNCVFIFFLIGNEIYTKAIGNIFVVVNTTKTINKLLLAGTIICYIVLAIIIYILIIIAIIKIEMLLFIQRFNITNFSAITFVCIVLIY